MSFTSWLDLWRMLEVPDWGFSLWSWWELVNNVLTHLCSEFEFFTLSLKVQRICMSIKSLLELWMTLEVPDWGFSSWSWWGWVNNVPSYPYSQFKPFMFYFELQRTLMSFKSCLELWRMLEVTDWGFSSWSWWGWFNNCLANPCSKFELSTLNLKVQKINMSLKSWLELWRML